MDQDAKNLKILEIAADVRKFEISLFWNRSLFFWGFSTVAITAYGAAYHYHASKEIQFAVACAGLVCSVVWSLVNRSSKYWQKIWETKATSASCEAIGCDLFAEPRPPQLNYLGHLQNFPWWAAHFSVSKLATAFSDFTALIWIGLAFKASPFVSWIPRDRLRLFAAISTLAYIIYIFLVCRSDTALTLWGWLRRFARRHSV